MVWAISRVQELDQEKSSGWTPKLNRPSQLADTPQEEALRLDLWEVSKNPNYSKAAVKKGTRWAMEMVLLGL